MRALTVVEGGRGAGGHRAHARAQVLDMRGELHGGALRLAHGAVALSGAVADRALGELAAAHLLALALAVAVALARLLAAGHVRQDAPRLVDLRALDATRADVLQAAAVRAAAPAAAPLAAACAARGVAADLQARVRVRLRVTVRLRVRLKLRVRVRIRVRVWVKG